MYFVLYIIHVFCIIHNSCILQIDSSTIDGNVEFVHSQYSCILTSQASIQFLCPTKLLIIIVIILEKSAYLAENKCNFMCSSVSVYTVFYLIWKTCQLI